MDNFKGKHIWIIGASSGIGADLARELSRRGAVLALSARSAEKLEALRDELGTEHSVIPFDVGDDEALISAASQLKEKFGVLDSVINMAAIYDPGALRDMDAKSMRTILKVNLEGMFHVVQSVLPIMRAQQKGQIVLCGSVAGYRGLPNGQPYSATKAAVINLAETLRAEEGDLLDIKVINPGFVETPMTDQNDFDMPMKITSDKAAKAIADGLLTRKFEIHFPKKFTLIMKLIHLLPAWLYFKIAKKLDV